MESPAPLQEVEDDPFAGIWEDMRSVQESGNKVSKLIRDFHSVLSCFTGLSTIILIVVFFSFIPQHVCD